MCVSMRIDMRIDMRIGIYIDMCIDMWRALLLEATDVVACLVPPIPNRFAVPKKRHRLK